MMSPKTIHKRNQEAKKKASEMGKKPYVVHNKEAIDEFGDSFPFPDLGDYRPEGWELIDKYFVDSTGIGGSGEPAKSVDQFKRALKSDMDEEGIFGYAVIEAGEFQVYVGKFRKLDE